MGYRTILAHVHDSCRAVRLLEAAVPLARSMDAHLIGLCVLPPFVVLPAMDGGSVAVTVEEHRDSYLKEMTLLKGQFASATKSQDMRSEWREVDAGFMTAAGAVIEHARSVDLVIACQRDRDWMYSSMLEEPERIAMESGRPLLLIPNAGQASMPARRVTVAWNARREAARAVFDALPLLKQAQAVNVVWVNPSDDRSVAGDLPAVGICSMLARHGVKCEASEATAVGADVGLELIRQATAFGSDLLVMGCYGHSRVREFILGGASRHIFENMSMPVLMAH